MNGLPAPNNDASSSNTLLNGAGQGQIPDPQGGNLGGVGMNQGMTGPLSGMNQAMNGPLAGMGGMGMGGMGMGMGMQQGMESAMNAGSSDMNSIMGQGNGFVPELDMMAMLRARQKMNMGMNPMGMMNMNMNFGMPDKLLAMNQEQFMKGKGLPGSTDNNQISSVLIDNLKRSAADMVHTDDMEEASGKRKKKSKKPNDMPRRALSAYNIFFSEQRGLILKEIDQKSKVGEAGDSTKKDEDAEKAGEGTESKTEEGNDKEKEKEEEVPKVMNRTFFPTRAKRAHRKVHGKIGLVDLARQVSARWKALTSEGKKPYQELAEKDRQRHKKVMAEYQERKAAENMISMGSPVQEAQDAPDIPPMGALPGTNPLNMNSSLQQQQHQQLPAPSDQELRENMAHQYQQRILADMMAARQPGNMGMNMAGMQMMTPQQQQLAMAQQDMATMAAQQEMVMNQRFNNALQAGTGGGQGGASRLADPNNLMGGLQGLQNQTRAQMWQQMGMGPL